MLRTGALVMPCFACVVLQAVLLYVGLAQGVWRNYRRGA